ncbi:hypothetical protein [Pedococcus sp. P5_B7]
MVGVAMGMAFILGYGLTKAVAPLKSAFLDSFVLIVAVTVGVFLGDATRRRATKP